MSTRRHPYAEYESTPIWKVLEKGVRALAKNGDVQEATARPYIVGYLAKLLTEAGFQEVSQLRTGRRVRHVVEVRAGKSAERAGAA